MWEGDFEYCSCSCCLSFFNEVNFQGSSFKLSGMEAGENLTRFLKDKDDERITIAEKHHQKLQRSTRKVEL